MTLFVMPPHTVHRLRSGELDPLDQAVRQQLEVLLAEKARLAEENSRWGGIMRKSGCSTVAVALQQMCFQLCTVLALYILRFTELNK